MLGPYVHATKTNAQLALPALRTITTIPHTPCCLLFLLPEGTFEEGKQSTQQMARKGSPSCAAMGMD